MLPHTRPSVHYGTTQYLQQPAEDFVAPVELGRGGQSHTKLGTPGQPLPCQQTPLIVQQLYGGILEQRGNGDNLPFVLELLLPSDVDAVESRDLSKDVCQK